MLVCHRLIRYTGKIESWDLLVTIEHVVKEVVAGRREYMLL